MNIKERFEKRVERVPESGCWLWIGAVNHDGYGRLCANGRKLFAHRISWEMFCGSIPKNLYVLHRCDVRCCVNPDHLYIGTQKDNVKDRFERNRSAKGPKNGNSKLTDKEVHQSRMLVNKGWSRQEVGDMFGVREQTISAIINGKTWTHLK